MMILLTINIVTGVFLLLSFVIIRNLSIQNSKYESHIVEMSEEFFKILDNVRGDVSDTLQHMRDIDSKQMFEKDDDVGVIFEELTNSIEKLNNELEIYGQETTED